MKVKDLAEYCKSVNINCDICDFKEACRNMSIFLEGLSPIGVIEFVEQNSEV